MTLQTNPGGYASEMIADRFQVMSSVIGKTFFVSDVSLPDMVVRGTDGNILKFNSIEEAKFYILSFTSHEDQAITEQSKAWKRKVNMTNATARATKELKNARKAAAAADAQLDGANGMIPAKPAKKIAALRASAAPKKTEGKVIDLKPGKAAKPVASKPAKSGALPAREDGEGSGAYIRRLLRGGVTSTEAILEAVHAQFPGSKAKASDVSWNKGKMKKDGETLPNKAA
jgi:hypothetical protein